MDFVADSIIKGQAYPALARHQARPYTPGWREFGQHWPHTTPAELWGHMRDHGVEYNISTDGSGYYVIGLGFFDFTIDYFVLLETGLASRIRSGQVTVLFYYHEGDNPAHIHQRLAQLCRIHNYPESCYRFVSGNTAAKNTPGFAYFPDHELLFWRRNRDVAPAELHSRTRPYTFVALSRTHKWWRASVMADMLQSGLLTNSLWSYNTNLILGDSPTDNPIEQQPGVDIPSFMRGGPYTCDTLNAEQHNDHSLAVEHHYTDAYFNIVIETHFDADGSRGAFLTEKTFKPIKNAQPFVIVGTPGSLQCLRDLGYRTFDSVLDNSYDTEINNTQRWLKIKNTLKQIQQDPHGMLLACWDDILHNQQLFLSDKSSRLNSLFTQLNKYD